MPSNPQESFPVPTYRCCGNHWHFTPPKHDGGASREDNYVSTVSAKPWYWRNAYPSDDNPVGEEVYIRSGHTTSRPYKVAKWLESGFCSLKTQEGAVLKCVTKYGREEDQLYMRQDLQSPPNYEQSGDFKKAA